MTKIRITPKEEDKDRMEEKKKVFKEFERRVIGASPIKDYSFNIDVRTNKFKVEGTYVRPE